MDDADDLNAERADVDAPPEGDEDGEVSWPVLSDIDLAVCLVDHGRADAFSPISQRPST